jgi:hypothetical protein
LMKAHPESNDEARIGAHSHSSLWGNGMAPVIRVSAFLVCEEERGCSRAPPWAGIMAYGPYKDERLSHAVN